MILKYDHYRTGQERSGPAPSSSRPLGNCPAPCCRSFSSSTCRRAFRPRAVRQPPGKLPDLFKAEKYDEVISSADAILKGDPLNPVALSYRGFASFYQAIAQNATEERMPFLDQAIVSLRRARLAGTPFSGETDYVLARRTSTRGSITTTSPSPAWRAPWPRDTCRRIRTSTSARRTRSWATTRRAWIIF